MDTIPEHQQIQVRMALWQRPQQYVVLFLSIITTATAAVLQSLETREPYHMSILTREGWVMELLSGHPDRIRCELGMSHDVFSGLF